MTPSNWPFAAAAPAAVAPLAVDLIVTDAQRRRNAVKQSRPPRGAPR
jgi:hypothetical protein